MGAKKQARKAFREAEFRIELLTEAAVAHITAQLDTVDRMVHEVQQSAADALERNRLAADAGERQQLLLAEARDRVVDLAAGVEARLRDHLASSEQQQRAAVADVDTRCSAEAERLTQAVNAAIARINDADARCSAEAERLTQAVNAAIARTNDADARCSAEAERLTQAVNAAIARINDAGNEQVRRFEPLTTETVAGVPADAAPALPSDSPSDATTEPVASSAPPEPVAPVAPVAPAVHAVPIAPAVVVAERNHCGDAVTFRTDAAQLAASLSHLTRGAADGWVLAEIVHRSTQGRPTAFLRLTVRDVSGWWEHHDVPGVASAFTRMSTVFDARELTDAVDLARTVDGDGLELALDGDATVGTTLVLSRDVEFPRLTGERRKVRRIDLRCAGPEGLALETDAGRLLVPSRLVSLLRSRKALEVDLITVDDIPCLSAPVSGPSSDVTATINAVVYDDGDDHQMASERREERESPISQLVTAVSSSSTPDELAAILTHGVHYARRRAAAHPALPEGLIDAVVRDGGEAMRTAAAANPSISVAAIERAAEDPVAAVRVAVAAHEHVPMAILVRLARDDDAEVRRRVVANPGLPVEIATLLAKDADPSVRAAVAALANCPRETLATLARDWSPEVCGAVARNPGCPVELLDELLPIVPEDVLSNPSVPEHLLVAAGQISSSRLRVAVAGNPATPGRQLQALARDPDPRIAEALASNPNAPASAQRRARSRSSHPAGTAVPDDATRRDS